MWYQFLNSFHLQVGAGYPEVGADRQSLSDDLADFLATCEAGRFYTRLADLWGIDPLDPRLKRLAFKLVFFGRVRSEGQLQFDRWQDFYTR
jgi:hypothetical protein